MKTLVTADFDSVESVDVRDLKRLIASGKILAFRRSTGWVKVGEGPIRGDGGQYDGPERRNVVQKPLKEEQLRSKHYCVLGVCGPRTEW